MLPSRLHVSTATNYEHHYGILILLGNWPVVGTHILKDT